MNNKLLGVLSFADDTKLLASTPYMLQKMLTDFEHIIEEIGLKMNLKKMEWGGT